MEKATITLKSVLFLLLGFSQVSFAMVLEHIKPTLNYDHHYKVAHEKVTDQYLSVSVEKTRFPNNPTQKAKFEEALGVLEEVLNSEEFKLRVLSYKKSSGEREYQKNYLWNNRNERLTNEDVYNILMEANEHTFPNTTAEMNIHARVRKCGWFKRIVSIWCRKVIGSTAPRKSTWMTLNWKFYRKYQTHNMVANIVHEWIHLLGFLHGRENMREEVPYVVGAIAGQVAKEILENR